MTQAIYLSISYNVANLPRLVESNGSSLTYSYLSDGTKVSALLQNDYLPFGTRVSGYGYATLEDNRYRYAGKEEQRLGNADGQLNLGQLDFGARWYDPTICRWTSVDPLAHKYPGLTPYNYCGGDPINRIDPDGRDGVFIAFPDYKISSGVLHLPKLGHAGVLLINNKTGATKYYEYGRYDREKKGIVRSPKIPDLVIGKDGRPTKESLDIVLKSISKQAGHGGRIEGAYIESDVFQKMKVAAESMANDNDNPDRQEYNLLSNNCATFAIKVLSTDTDAAS